MKHLVLLVLFHIVYGSEDGPTISIPDGQLKGSIRETIGQHKPYYTFKGIPYAQPPIGELRFAEPVKNDPWSGLLDATHQGSKCIQLDPPIPNGQPAEVVGSEDCLFINVYTPNVNGSLPVMAWIHGGGFIAGSSNYEEFGPDYLLEQDVVYVAFNYRLGLFGFLSTQDTVAPGNWGLKDQVLALQWVKNNIKYFGGDPDKITIFGESAGGASVSYLLQIPQTNGLFRAAIMESGNSLCLWSFTRTPRDNTFEFGRTQGVTSTSSEDLVTQLRTIDAATLKQAESDYSLVKFLTGNILGGLPFAVGTEPEIDTAILSGKSHEQISKGNFTRVPLLVGYNSKEAGCLNDYIDVVKQILYTYDLLVTKLAPSGLSSNMISLFMAGQEVRNYFCDNSSLTSNPSAVLNITSVDQFNRPIREAIKQYSKYVDVFFYRFSYEGRLGNPNRDYEGVGHAEELNYIFVSSNPADPIDIEVRNKMVLMWTNFAKYLNPTPEDSRDNLDGVTWQPNSPQVSNDGAQYLNIGKVLETRSDPDDSDWKFYQQVFDKYGSPPYDTY